MFAVSVLISYTHSTFYTLVRVLYPVRSPRFVPQALFISSRVPEATLPPSYPGGANFSLISLKTSTNCLHENANSSRGVGQLGWASCLVSAGRVTLSGGTTFSHITFSPTRGEMAQIVSGARHFVEYVTCLAVLRETSVLEGTAVTTHNSM